MEGKTVEIPLKLSISRR